MKRWAIVRQAAMVGVCSIAGSLFARSAVTEWNEFATETIVRQINPGPPAAARFYAVLNTCIYDAWAAYDPVAVGTCTGDSLQVPASENTESMKREAVNHAAYAALLNLAPSLATEIDAFLLSRGYELESLSPAAVTGRAAAAAVLAYCSTDCSNQGRNYRDTSGYETLDPAENPAAFQFIEIGDVIQTKAAQPHWTDVIPFALSSASEFRPAPPPAYGSGEWNRQVEEVINFNHTITDEQKVIADYWKMEGNGSRTPPGHLLMLSAWKSEQLGYGIDEDSKMFFVVSQAISDAGIACWETKYFYDYVRPITAIRALGGRQITGWRGPGQGVGPIPAENWLPYQPLQFISPPFPEYTSGHATFTAAWAEAMRLVTGSDRFGFSETYTTLPIDNDAPLATPITLTYTDYYSAAFDSAISRLYGGVHWRVGMDAGLDQGAKVGAKVFQRANQFLTGQAATSFYHLSNLSAGPWEAVTISGSSLLPPIFLHQTTGGDNIGLRVDDNGRRPMFGFWQTLPMDPLPVGEYKLRVDLSILDGPPGTRRPEIRVRVLRTDNTQHAIGVLAQPNASQSVGNSVDVTWTSDGQSPYLVAVDILATGPDQVGGFRILSASNTKVLTRPIAR